MKKIKLPRLTTDDPMEVIVQKEFFKIKNQYQLIEIVRTKEFGKCLLIDGLMQASEMDHEIYDDKLILRLSENDERILILGGGDGFIASTILKRHPKIKKIDIVDIDKDVVDSCNKFFERPAFFAEKVKFHVEDAVKFLEDNQKSKKYSAVIFDFTDIPVAGGKSIEIFYERLVALIKNIVLPTGWIAVYAGSPGVTDKYFNAERSVVKLFKGDYDNIIRQNVFVPCFGEESTLVTIEKRKKYIYDLQDKVLKSDTQILGGKGFSLHEMVKNNINVPDAFVISSELFHDLMVKQEIFHKVEILLGKARVSSFDEVSEISTKIRLILSGIVIPEEFKKDILKQFESSGFSKVSVRSSATLEDGKENAWAGQLETFLNISQNNLLESIKKCWLSLYSERALVYMKENNFLHKKVGVAVVIQKMIDSEVSGVGFSINPTDGDANIVIIESIYGLGEFMVAGSVTPDSYYISKDQRMIIQKNLVSQKKKLVLDKESGTVVIKTDDAKDGNVKMTDSQYLNLFDKIISCENLFKWPQDVEWALKNNKLYILQSRPITAISSNLIPDFSEYTKIYTAENIFPPLFMDLAISAKYLPFDGLFLFDNYKTTLLIENKSLIKSKAIGSNVLLSPKYYLQFRKEAMVIKKEIRRIKLDIKKVKDKNTIKKILDNYFYIFKKAIYQYSFTEFFYTIGAEEKILRELRDELGDRVYPSIIYDLVSGNNKTKISKAVGMQINFLERAGEEKLSFREIMNELSMLIEDIFELISLQLKIDTDILEFLTVEEFKNFLNGSLTDDLAMVIYDARRRYFVQKAEDGKVFIYQGQEAKNLVEFYKKTEINSGGKKWVGRGVFAGFYTGVVKRIPYFMNTNDEEYLKCINNFKEGDILLARSTGPELTPIIKKAGAIISEEGGIMSHAAVVCREFKKPGVVGIPNIFESLSDGARVYVDGKNGTIILEE